VTHKAFLKLKNFYNY